MAHPAVIPLTACVARHVYRLRSRNLSVGVFDGKNGFIGIRVKFNDEFLFTEFHWDAGPPFGTVHPIEDIGVLPEDIEPIEGIGSFDSVTERPVDFRRLNADGKGEWFFTDTGEGSKDIRAYHSSNTALFEFLKPLDDKEQEDHEGDWLVTCSECKTHLKKRDSKRVGIDYRCSKCLDAPARL